MVETTATYPHGMGGRKVNNRPQPDTWHAIEPRDHRDYHVLAPQLEEDYQYMVNELLDIWANRLRRNRTKFSYYNGRNKLKDFGISIPPTILHKCETVVGWPQKSVDALATRSRYDGWTATDEQVQFILDGVTERSRLGVKYRQAVTSELIYGCCFATVGVDENGLSRIDLHSAENAAAVWDDAKGRIAYGMVIDEFYHGRPVQVSLYTDDALIHLWDSGAGIWEAEVEPYSMGRPTMEAFAYRPTLRKPFGQSRISGAVMSLTDEAVRESLRTSLSAEFFTSPQKFLLGADPSAFEGRTRWEAYIGNIFTVSRDADGNIPQYGQLPQGSMQPHTDYMRSLASRFAGETNVPLHMLGVVSDNPSSAEAIYAANEPLIIEAEDLNASSRDSLKSLALMCVSAELDTPLDELTVEQRDLSANFVSPAMPSVVSQTDAAVKIASVVPDFAGTPSFWKMIGMPEDARREVEAETKKAAANTMLLNMFSGGDTTEESE